MTNKQILTMAINEDIQYYLEMIKFENDNLDCKTRLEQKSAKRRIKNFTMKIKEILGEEQDMFKLFYDYDYKKAQQYAEDYHMHKMWIPESEGVNGNSYLVFKDTDHIPKYLKSYVIKNSNLWDQ